MMRSTARVLGMSAAVALLNIGGLAHAQLVINPTFATNIKSDPNVVAIEAGINAVIARIEADITNPITVNILYQETNTGLGGSSTFIGNVPYGPAGTAGTYLNALTTKQTVSANDTIAITHLGNLGNSTNPVNGNANVRLTTPLGRALGFSGFNVASDCTISLNTSLMYFTRGGSHPGLYDLQAVAGHETDEALGIGGTGSTLPTTTGAVGPLDLYRYTAAGVRSYATGTNIAPYFSLDAGTTDLVHFNQTGGGADYSDWGNGVIPAQSSGNSPAQMQDAFGSTNVDLNIGANELIGLDVIGYDVNAVPEPGTLMLTGAGLAAAFVRRRRAAIAA